eukprot:Pgem_evm3s8792
MGLFGNIKNKIRSGWQSFKRNPLRVISKGVNFGRQALALGLNFKNNVQGMKADTGNFKENWNKAKDVRQKVVQFAGAGGGGGGGGGGCY